MKGLVINKTLPDSVVLQIANGIIRMILAQHIKPGEKLPPERMLAEQLGVARGTVNRAYVKLAEMHIVEVRDRSGWYVTSTRQTLEDARKAEATELLEDTLRRLGEMGLSAKEIQNLLNLRRRPSDHVHRVNILVLSNNYEILSELEEQLSYLGSTWFFFTLSYYTIGNLKGNPDPIQMLYNYDLIIATSIDYPEICGMAPLFRHKIIEATISPRTRTLYTLSALSKEERIAIIYRTPTFRAMVLDAFLSLGFSEKNLLPFQERDYNPASHFQDGVTALVNFNESPVLTDPEFHQRNEAFLQGGGQILRFEYRIDRSALIRIEDRIQLLLNQLE